MTRSARSTLLIAICAKRRMHHRVLGRHALHDVKRKIEEHTLGSGHQFDPPRLAGQKRTFPDPVSSGAEMREMRSAFARRDRDAHRASGDAVDAARRVAQVITGAPHSNC
jgi:hypothetical protein